MAFDSLGHTQWSRGGPSDTVFAFGNVTDLQTSTDGTAWLVDAGRKRLVLISPTGTFVRTIPIDDRVLRIIPPTLSDGGAFLAVLAGRGPWTKHSADGGVLAHGQFTDSTLMQTTPFARQPLTAIEVGTSLWVAVYPFGDRLEVRRDTALVCSERLREGMPFPRPRETRISVSAAAVTFLDSTILVLSAGSRESRFQVVDTYSTTTCAYKGSIRLPFRATAMSAAAGVVYLGRESPTSSVVALRLADELTVR